MTGPTVFPSSGQRRSAPADKSRPPQAANNQTDIDTAQLHQQLASLQAHLARLEGRNQTAQPARRPADWSQAQARQRYDVAPVRPKNRVPVSQENPSGFRFGKLIFPLLIISANVFILETVLSSQTPKTSLFARNFWESTPVWPAIDYAQNLLETTAMPQAAQNSSSGSVTDMTSGTTGPENIPQIKAGEPVRQVTGNSQIHQTPSVLNHLLNQSVSDTPPADAGQTPQAQPAQADPLSLDRLEQAVLGELSTTRNEIDRLAVSQQESDAILQDIQSRLDLFSRYIAYRSKGYSVSKAWSRANISPNASLAPPPQKKTDATVNNGTTGPLLTDPLVSSSLPPLPVGQVSGASPAKVAPAPLGYFYRTEGNETPLQISAMHGVSANELSRQNGWSLKNLNVPLAKGTRIFIPEGR